MNYQNSSSVDDRVGPVLVADSAGRAVAAAIQQLNRDVQIIDRGSYWRVLVPHRCVVTRQAIEAVAGGEFRFPADLERVMPSFKGRLSLSAEEAQWSLGPP